MASSAQAPASSQSEAKQGLIDFIIEAGTLDGKVGICDAREADIIQICSTQIADNWSRITGTPPVTDPAFRKTVTDTWSSAVVRAADIQSKRKPSSCVAVLEESRQSGIWKICKRPPDRPLALPGALKMSSGTDSICREPDEAPT